MSPDNMLRAIICDTPKQGFERASVLTEDDEHLSEKHVPGTVLLGSVNGRAFTLLDLLTSLKLTLNYQTLQDAVRFKLLLQAFDEKSISASAEEVGRHVDQYRQDLQLYTDSDTRAWLEQNDLTDEEFFALYEFAFKVGKLKHVITEDRVEERFAFQKVDLEQVELYRLVVADEMQARELKLSAQEGVKFFGLAKDYSEDETTRRQCGYLGIVRRRSLRPEVESAVFAAREGEVVGPIKTVGAYHLYLIEKFYPATLDDDMREMIAEELFQQWLERLQQNADIQLLF